MSETIELTLKTDSYHRLHLLNSVALFLRIYTSLLIILKIIILKIYAILDILI